MADKYSAVAFDTYCVLDFSDVFGLNADVVSVSVTVAVSDVTDVYDVTDTPTDIYAFTSVPNEIFCHFFLFC